MPQSYPQESLDRHIFVTDGDMKQLHLLIEDLPIGKQTIDGISIECKRSKIEDETYELINFTGNEGGIIKLVVRYYTPENSKEREKYIGHMSIKLGDKDMHSIPQLISQENELPLDIYNKLKDLLQKCRQQHNLEDRDINQLLESSGAKARRILGM